MGDSSPIKVVFCGDSSTGKTSVLLNYINGSAPKSTKPTIAAAFFTREVKIHERLFDLVLWDTAGQETYRGLAPMYYRGSALAFLLFDVTSRKTFENLGDWIQSIRSEAGDKTIISIVGNKIDIEDLREIDTFQAQDYATNEHCLYFETSAITGHGIDRMMQISLEELATSFIPEDKPTPVPIAITENPQKNGGCC